MSSLDGVKGKKIESLSKYYNFIETVRHNKVPDKTSLKNLAGVAWPTLQNALVDFHEKDSPIVVNDEGFFLNKSFSIHAGISLGATQIKLYLCDFSFGPLNKTYFDSNGLNKVYLELQQDDIKSDKDKIEDSNYFCYKREDSIDGIIERLKKIFDALIEIDDKTSNLLSVGISFPGIINKEKFVIEFSPNIKCLRNVCVRDLLSNELWKRLDQRKISVFFEHDTQAASIFEKESLYKLNEENSNNKKNYASAKNICCVYIAAGIGGSLILDNKLCRGITNSFGEFGHTPAPDLFVDKLHNSKLTEEELNDKYCYDKKLINSCINENNDETNCATNKAEKHIYPCECGKIACLESAFRRKVFDSYDLDDYLDKINNENELKNFAKIHPYRYRVLKEYVSYIIGLLINFFNPELIIFSGRIMREVVQLHNELNTLKANSAIGIPAYNCDIILGSQKIYSAAAGTAISSYHCCIKNKSFCDLCW